MKRIVCLCVFAALIVVLSAEPSPARAAGPTCASCDIFGGCLGGFPAGCPDDCSGKGSLNNPFMTHIYLDPAGVKTITYRNGKTLTGAELAATGVPGVRVAVDIRAIKQVTMIDGTKGKGSKLLDIVAKRNFKRIQQSADPASL